MGLRSPRSTDPAVRADADQDATLRVPAPPAAAERDAHAQAEVLSAYDAWAPGLYRYLSAIGRNPVLAQDLLHEAFLRFHATLLTGESIHHPRAWLYLTSRRLLLDAEQAYGARHAVSLTDRPDVRLVTPAFDQEPAARWRDVWRAGARRLSPRERECLQLRAEGLTHREIAAILKIQVGTVCTLVARSIRKMQRLFGAAREGG